ncbi:hypothetical protein [Kitasatospora viridis]|uniref:L-2-amino-thiazoline-4-carboxylic acid hydrolase-like protein n=1 Tax=Kitasatospora viridis TaxID=281105 RepID=A0A561UIQ1_9ACTN|nr:hypothetical protein [Kitasatospora viridis]TWF99258.1 hypothetical protein FHX73_113101 [Kitasatospora viridis]
MTEHPPELDAELEQVFRHWWLHDARWYQGVRKRYGQQAANEINAEAVAFVGRRVAADYLRANPEQASAPSSAELAERIDAVLALMGADRMSQVSQHVIDDRTVETVVTKSFALQMLRAARALEGYECPCLELRASWFEGLRVPVSDCRLECQREGSETCRFRAELKTAQPET